MELVTNQAVSCFRYHKGTDFQANHNHHKEHPRMNELFQIPQRYRFSSKSQQSLILIMSLHVVLDTTKVQIFKQITTYNKVIYILSLLFQIPQRYRFSSKSQRNITTLLSILSCFRYHKGTDFQANHNVLGGVTSFIFVVLDTTKVQIFKQITTPLSLMSDKVKLFQIPQRYRFSSKSQQYSADRH